MKKILTILSFLISSYSFSQVVVKVPQQDISGKVNKSDSGIIYVTPNDLGKKVDTTHKDTTVAVPPVFFTNSSPTHHQIGLYMTTDTTFGNATDTTAASSLAVKKYTDLRADSLGWFVATKHGLVGDSATDNTAAMRALFNAVPASGGTVYFPHGIYLVSDSIVIPRKCRIIGDGQGKTYSQLNNDYINSGSVIIQTGLNKSLFVVNGRGVSFEFIGLNNGVDNPTAGAGIRFNEGREFYMNKVRIENFYINVDVLNGDLWAIDHSYFQDAVLYNLKIADSASADAGDQTITNSWFFAGKYAGTTNIRYLSGAGLKVSNCKLHGSAHTAFSNAPLYHIDATSIKASSLLLVQNTSIEYFRQGAIKLSNASGIKFGDVIINGNQISSGGNIAHHSIDIEGNSAGSGSLLSVVVTNNIIDITNDTLAATYISNANSGVVTGNIYTSGHPYTDSIVGCTNFIYYQPLLTSGTTIKTFNGNSLLGSGNVGNVPDSLNLISATNWRTYINKIDLSAKSTFPAIDLVFPGGSSSAGSGILREAQVSVLGTNDIFLQLLPLTTSGYSYLEGFNSGGLVLGTGNDANNSTAPIIFRPNRVEVGRITTTGRFGMNTTSPNSTLHDNGSFATGYVAKTATYTATANDYTIDCNGTFTVTLPTAVGITGRIYVIKNSGSGTITMAGTSSQTFDGATSPTIAAGAAVQWQSNNANWIKIN